MTLLPDEPRWVEANAIAADPASWRAPGLVGNDALQLIAVTDPAAVDRAKLAPGFTILTVDELFARTLDHARAILHVLDAPLPDLEGATLLDRDVSLDHLPAPLAAEIRRADRVWTVFVDEVPVAFAYAPWRTQKWFDVSVDVVPSARQLGLGSIVAAAMIHDEMSRGRTPVWGADEANHASLRLAARLGFAPIDHIFVCTMPA